MTPSARAPKKKDLPGRRFVGTHFLSARPLMRDPKKEARGRKRITKVLPVDCTVQALPLNRTSRHYLRPGDSFGGRTVNLSQIGLQVHSDIELDPMTVLDVTLTLEQDRRITLRTQIVWAKRNAFDIYGRWRMGLRFIESLPGELEALQTYYKHLQSV